MIKLLLIFAPWLTIIQPDVVSHKDPQSVDVYVFLACECPISQKYVPILNSIYSTYKDTPGFNWTFVIPGRIKKSEVQTFIKEFDVQFPLEVDARTNTVKKLHASTTPQVIIVKDSIVYTGAIDNWFYELGKYRREATENYLIDALEAIRQGRGPTVSETEAVGCPIAIPK